VDSSESLIKAVSVGKKTGYPQLWRAVLGPESERKAAEANDGLINTLKWNKVPSDAEHHNA